MSDTKQNHGVVESGNIVEAYGKDDSNFTGSAQAERGKKPGGSVTDLSHTMSGGKANQHNP